MRAAGRSYTPIRNDLSVHRVLPLSCSLSSKDKPQVEFSKVFPFHRITLNISPQADRYKMQFWPEEELSERH